MGMHDKIEMHLSGHAQVEVTAYQVDCAIARHLPASPYELCTRIDAHKNNGFKAGHYRDLVTVTELLLVLTELDNRSAD